MKEQIRSILEDLLSKNDQTNNSLDEAVDKLASMIPSEPTPYEQAGELLSIDSDGLTLQEMLDAIIEQNKINGTVMVDTLDGVYMWEKLEWSFTCENFLKHIGHE